MPRIALLTQGIREFPVNGEAKVGATPHPWCQLKEAQCQGSTILELTFHLHLKINRLVLGWLFKDSLCQPPPSLQGTVWKHSAGGALTDSGRCPRGLDRISHFPAGVEQRALGQWSCLGLSLLARPLVGRRGTSAAAACTKGGVPRKVSLASR